jgi:hypothetical protein
VSDYLGYGVIEDLLENENYRLQISRVEKLKDINNEYEEIIEKGEMEYSLSIFQEDEEEIPFYFDLDEKQIKKLISDLQKFVEADYSNKI